MGHGGAGKGLGRRGQDDEVVGMAGGAGLNLVGAAFSQLAVAGIFMVLSRALGPADLGIYGQAFAVMSLLSLLSLSGLQAGLTRFVAVYLATGNRAAVRGTVRVGLALTTAFAVVLGIGLFCAAPWLATHAFDEPRLGNPLRYTALTLPALTFMDAALAGTKGFRSMRSYAYVGLLLEPAIRFGLTLALVAGGMGVDGAMIAMLSSSSIGAIAAAVALRRVMGDASGPAPIYRVSPLLRFSMVSWMAGLATTGLIWADTLLLGIYGASADVGVYNVATRIVVLATFVMLPINASFAPRIADLYQRGDSENLARGYRVATSWILRLSLPAFVLIVLYPGALLSLFGGDAFVAGATVTVLLTAGKLVDAATGPCALMLTMSGRPVLAMLDNVGVLIANVALNIWLIPRYGILGSAVAWGLSLAIVNLARLCQVWMTMRMLPFGAGVFKGIVAALGALVVGLAARGAVTGPVALLVGGAGVGVVYVALIAALGVTAEDRLVLRALAARIWPQKAAGAVTADGPRV